MRFALVSLAVAAMVAGAGCASSTDDAADSAADLTSVATPITVGNFISHPKIKEIRAEVAAVDAAKLTSAKKDASCPAADAEESWTKFTDEAGTIRKFVDSWGGSDGDETTTYYYDAAGHLRFVFDVLEGAPADDSLHVTDTRVYFDAAGARIFEVAQTGNGTTAHPPAMANRPYELPADAKEIDPQLVSNPAAYFDSPPKCD